MGKPCVASRVGPLPEVVEDGRSGFLVKPQSSGALAEAIILLARNRKLAHEMGYQGRQIVMERFIIDHTIKQLEAVYDQVLHAK